MRLAYSSLYDKLSNVENPFDIKCEVFKFAKKNYLLGHRNRPMGYNNNVLNNTQKYGKELKILNSMLRLLLFVLGPNRFYLLSKGFVFLSSPRLNKNLWKF